MEVTFQSKFPWSVLPYKQKVDWKTKKVDSEIYQQYFRWIRGHRVAELCWPWRLGHEIGWLVPSPVEIVMTPVDDIEISCSKEDMRSFRGITGYTELWKREQSFLAVQKTGWLRLYDFQTDRGWESMFVPNGEGSVEWHLGWQLHMPEDFYLLILPSPELPDLQVPPGVLDAATVRRLNNEHGVSIAVRPRASVKIKRRQPVARLILLHEDSLKVSANFEEVPSDGQ